ncbi:MAG: hypothetical protein TYPL_2100 [Candidatus Tyloplasma litorale]|nr:MAG: hypothetical protein TYPL_2100 [Mycoplasmatales bacterium]
MNNNEKGPLQNRKERIFFFYKFYLQGADLNKKEELLLELKENLEKNQIQFIVKCLEHFDEIETELKKHLPNNWEWSRFNIVEKAIIFNATSEILIAHNKKAIIINESIEFAKKYCGKKSQSLINGIIDKIEVN